MEGGDSTLEDPPNPGLVHPWPMWQNDALEFDQNLADLHLGSVFLRATPMTLRRFVNMFASRNHSSESSDLPITKLSQLDSQGKVGFLILWEPLLVSYLVEFQQFLAVLEQLLPCLTVKLHYTDTLNGDGFCHGIMGEILDTLLWNTHTHIYCIIWIHILLLCIIYAYYGYIMDTYYGYIYIYILCVLLCGYCVYYIYVYMDDGWYAIALEYQETSLG